jgi:hypothetical protein
VVIESAEVEGITATVAFAFLVLSAALVAVTVTLVLLVTVGAVNIPPLETVPPVADQATAVLLVPCTVALNCWVLPEATLALPGDTVRLIAPGAFTVMVALAILVASATLVAVTVTLVVLVTLGAVNIPVLETVPPVADQVTAVLVVPRTRIPNCWVCPDDRVVLVGLTEMLTPDSEVVEIYI